MNLHPDPLPPLFKHFNCRLSEDGHDNDDDDGDDDNDYYDDHDQDHDDNDDHGDDDDESAPGSLLCDLSPIF